MTTYYSPSSSLSSPSSSLGSLSSPAAGTSPSSPSSSPSSSAGSKLHTREEMRAAALEIIKQQFAHQGKANKVVGLATNRNKNNNQLLGNSDSTLIVDDHDSESIAAAHERAHDDEDDDDDDITEYSFEITRFTSISKRRPSHALETTPKGTIPCWAYVVVGLLIIGVGVFTAVWMTRPQIVWQWEILPAYTREAITTNATSAQALAWEWLQAHPEFDTMPEWRVLQLMSLTTLYYGNYYLKAWPPVEIDDYELHECEWWLGSVCKDDGHYEKLSLYQREMDGSLPRQLAFLTDLTGLAFSDNQLTGPVPSQLGELTALTFLGLHTNSFEGKLPSELGALTALTQLSVRRNQLTGTLPTQMGQLTHAVTMDLSGNQLVGSIPLEYASLISLTYLPLWGNSLTGTIPSQLGSLTKLTSLDVHNTDLTGTVPIELQDLIMMRSLLLHQTLLSGIVPPKLCGAVNLVEIWVDCPDVTCTCVPQCQCGSTTTASNNNDGQS